MTTRNTPPKRTGDGGRPKKIIDLEAKEVSGEKSNTDTKPEATKSASTVKAAADKTASTTKAAPGDGHRSAPQEPKDSSGNDGAHLTRHLPLVLAAIAGGVIALAGNGIVSSLSSSSNQQDDDIAALSGKLEESGTQIRGEVTKIQEGLENRLASLDGVTNKLSQQFDTARQEFTELTNKITTTDSGNSEFSDALKALGARIGSAEKLLRGLADNPEGNAGANTVQIEAFRVELEKQSDEITAMNSRLASLATTANDLEANAKKLDAATQEVRSIRDTQIGAEQARLRDVTADALKQAHVKGQNISALLTPARSMLSGTDEADRLQALAENGIATNEDLISGFRLKLREILGAVGKEPDGLVGKFLSNAMTLVTVKPAGPVEGDNPAAIASRIDAALGAGEFAKALKEWETLPQQSKDVSQDWQIKLKNRIEADKLLDQIVAELKSGNTNDG